MKRRIHLTPAEAAEKGLLCATHLKAIGLMPRVDAKAAGSVWQGQGAYYVYHAADCVPWKWTPGPTQLRRQAVAARAQDLIGGDCLLIDTETTGVDEDAEICEISIIDVTGAPILDTLIRPTRPIPAETTAIHKITDSMVANAPTWPEVAEQYAAIVHGRTVVAYNTAFDVRLLAQTHSRHGLVAPPLSATGCAMNLYASWNGEWDDGRSRWRWLKLVAAAEQCGVLEPEAHRALADARMTLGVLWFLQSRPNGRLPKRRPLPPAALANAEGPALTIGSQAQHTPQLENAQ